MVPYSHASGFTLVEIMIVVAIISLLAAIALPAFQKARINTQNSAFMNDIRIIENAIDMYIMEKKGYPAEVQEKITPTELVPYLKNVDFTKPTPIGGCWDYDNNLGMKCGIGVKWPERTTDEMAKLGKFIQSGGKFIVVIEP